MTSVTIDSLITNKENLSRVLDNLKEGIIAHDVNRRIFFFNKEAERITGYSRDEVLGRDCHEAFGSPFCGERCAFCETHTPRDDASDYAVNIVTKGGVPRRVELSLTMMRGDAGQFLGVLAAIRDITDLLHLKMQAGQLTRFANIIGKDTKMLQVFQQIRDVADYDYPVHIAGETGTGKELVANAIHNESRRDGNPFVPINCGALPEGLIESELFGHVKGAFSGAIRDKKGRFELAAGGTVFLDEVAELSKHMQVKLLRFLQEGTFERVGGEKTVRVQVRVISATNRDLKKQVQRGSFREDLFYRLNVIPILIPPLRERKNDIPLLIEQFLNEAGEQYGGKPLRVDQAALRLLMDYQWPGNVRELQNAIQFGIVKSSGRVIRVSDLPLELRGYRDQCLSRPSPPRKLDAERVRSALVKSGGNKAKAARILGVGRATLYRFLSRYPEVLADR